MLNKNYLELYYDNYNIYNLIKKTDKNYRLYFDTKNKEFLVANLSNYFEICLRAKTVDSRILIQLQKTLTVNSESIFKEIDNHNNLLTKKYIENNKQKSIDTAVEIAKLSKRTNHISYNEINKIKEGNYA